MFIPRPYLRCPHWLSGLYWVSGGWAGGGGGLGPKHLCAKMARPDFPNGKPPLFPRWSLWPRAMQQRILSSRTPPCGRRPVTAHEWSAALRRRSCSYLWSLAQPTQPTPPPTAPVRSMHSPHCSFTCTLLYSHAPPLTRGGYTIKCTTNALHHPRRDPVAGRGTVVVEGALATQAVPQTRRENNHDTCRGRRSGEGGINGRFRKTECPRHRQFQPLVQQYCEVRCPLLGWGAPLCNVQ